MFVLPCVCLPCLISKLQVLLASTHQYTRGHDTVPVCLLLLLCISFHMLGGLEDKREA